MGISVVLEARVADATALGANDSTRPIDKSDTTNASGASECAAVMLWTEEWQVEVIVTHAEVPA